MLMAGSDEIVLISRFGDIGVVVVYKIISFAKNMDCVLYLSIALKGRFCMHQESIQTSALAYIARRACSSVHE